MKQIRYLNLAFLALLSQIALGLVDYPSDPSEHPARPEYQAASRTAILRMVPGDQTAKVYIVGHETATFDFNELPVEFSTSAWNQEGNQTLNYYSQSDEVLISEARQWELSDATVQLETRGHTDQIRNTFENRAP